jgi:LPXTG-site transpeptidase (sortase) family protein
MRPQFSPPFHLLGFLLLLTGIVIFITGFALPPQTPIQDYDVQSTTLPKARKPTPTHIIISDFIDLPVEVMSFGPKGWEVASKAASIASTSAYPGESGNIVIYSHNLTRLFGKLSRTKIGDPITVTSEDGISHSYIVTKREVVNPDQIDSLRPTESETLTLYTCAGLFDSKRLVIQAKPKSRTEL